MNALLHPFLLTAIISILGGLTATAATTGSPASSAFSDAKCLTLQTVREPIEVTAEDLVTKAYGVIDADLSQEQVAECMEMMHLNATVEEENLWLDSADGYRVSYYGMTPEVSAYAKFENQEISGYSFFFMFPYDSSANKMSANDSQCEFCSTLLQELFDMGADMRADDSSESLFNAAGNYGDSNLNVSLIDNGIADNAGQYILILEVEPNAFTAADELPAIDNMMAAN